VTLILRIAPLTPIVHEKAEVFCEVVINVQLRVVPGLER
jgi:hypothetical protein